MAVLKILVWLWILTIWCLPSLPAQSITSEPAPVVAPTRSSNRTSSRCIPSERDALLVFRTGFTDPRGNYMSSWQGEDCCQWKGVRCSDRSGHVVELELYGLKEVNSSIALPEGQANSSLLGLQHLRSLDLSDNNFNAAPIPQFIGGLQNLRYLDLSNSNFSGQVPPHLGNLSKLLSLALGGNNLSGTLPSTFRNLHSLEELWLYENNISGPVSILLNRLPGNSLIRLMLDENKLTGSLSDQLGRLKKLMFLDLRSNNLDGTITESDLSALANLKEIYLSDNSLSIVFQHNWVPPFKLDVAALQSCKLGPKFPEWLRSQNSISILDISNTSISGPIPQWFWITFSETQFLVLSRNQISGMLSPTMFSKMEAQTMDFSDNLLVGSMPKLPTNLESLDLSKNNLSGPLPTDFGNSSLKMLNLFKNSIGGRIPYYFCYLEDVFWTCLKTNYMGNFPIAMIEFPSFLRNCQKLVFLDLSYNQFSGMLPPWIGDKLLSLAFLSLRSNLFFGHIPQKLAKMKGLQFLDLACNNLSGLIPQSLADFIAMAVAPQDNNTLSEIVDYGYDMNEDDVVSYTGSSLVVTKGEQLEFTSGIIYMVNLDLSCNILTGPIPGEIGKLGALKSLNLSWNHLNEMIPNSIGDIHSLESLDLSHNEFGGEIPATLSNLLSLSHLNLSYNNLTGRIPSGNQLQTLDDQASVYIGNLGLCGPPLSKNCSQTGLPPASPEGNKDGDDTVFFFLAMGSGYVMGLWTIFCLFLFMKKWRAVCFLFSDRLYDWFYVQVALGWASLKPKIGGS
ncbi:hypothetical protein EJB05_16287, partial [Eragrostis curvula]